MKFYIPENNQVHAANVSAATIFTKTGRKLASSSLKDYEKKQCTGVRIIPGNTPENDIELRYNPTKVTNDFISDVVTMMRSI